MVKVMLLFTVTILLFFACSKTEYREGDILKISKINKVININDVKTIIDYSSPKMKKMYSSPEGFKYFYNEYLRFFLFDAKAKDVGLKDIASNQYSVKKRLLYNSAGLYFSLLKDFGGVAYDTIENFYNKNINNYKYNNGKIKPLYLVKYEVLADYLNSRGVLKDYYSKHKEEFKREARINISQIFTKDLKSIQKAQNELKKDKFINVVRKYSQDSNSLKRGGNLGLYIKGVKIYNINKSDSLFDFLFNSKDSITSIYRSEKGYHIFKINSKKEAVYPEFNDIKQSVAIAYVGNIKNHLNKVYIDSIKKVYNIKPDFSKIVVTDSILKEYYKANSSKFLQEKRKIKAIYCKDFKNIGEVKKRLDKKENFDSLYLKFNKDDTTKYGLMFRSEYRYPEIGRECFKLKKVGDISDYFRTDNGYYVIRLEQIADKKSIPTFEQIKKDIYTNYLYSVINNSANSIIFSVGNDKYRYSDYANEFDSLNVDQVKTYCDTNNIKRIVNDLVVRYILKNESEKNGFNNTYLYKLLKEYWTVKEWSNILEKQFMDKYYGFTKSEIENFYKNNQKILKGINPNEYERICARMVINDDTLKVYYNKNIEKFVKNGRLVPFKYVRNTLYNKIKNQQLRNNKLKTFLNMFKEYGVEVLDKKYTPYFIKKFEKVHISKAKKDSLWAIADTNLIHNKVRNAMNIYKQIINSDDDYKKLDSYVHLARLYEGQKSYGKALNIYDYLLSQKKYVTDDVLFLTGFLYYDALGEKEEGKKYFKRLIKEFPKSELVDDAQALLKPNSFLKSLEKNR